MTLAHRKVQSSNYPQFSLGANASTFSRPTGGVFTWLATSRGRTLSATGTSLWDTALQPTSLSTTLGNNAVVALPFKDTNLPTNLFDAIIEVLVDGTDKYAYAFSNSPDNSLGAVGVTTTQTNLFYADLWTFATGNGTGNPDALEDYVFGGQGVQADVNRAYKIKFLRPVETAFVLTATIKYFRKLQGFIPYDIVTTTAVPVGATELTFFNGNIIGQIYTFTGLVAYQFPGHFKVSFTTDNPDYTSMLNVYHWGVKFPANLQ
jgi:hypothetical protein